MGVNNRQRRKAKQKARQERQRAQVRFEEEIVDIANAIEDAVLMALHAKATHDVALLDKTVAWLADPQGGGLADTVLTTMLDEAVTSVWEGGWQPADLLCASRRAIDAAGERMLIDFIASEMRRYGRTTVDEEWEGQLATIVARVWWPRDDEYFDAWAVRHSIDKIRTIGYAIEVLDFLGALPVLPQLCPIPGQARRGSLASTARDFDHRVLDRVRALLAKAESTDFPEEAETYTAKAQELMARHSIDYALLGSKQQRKEEPGGRRIAIDNPYEAPKALLLDVTAHANRCRAVWSRQLGFSTVLGFPADVVATELLFTSLLVQATAALAHAGSRKDTRLPSFRRSFLTAYANRIAQRLERATAAAGEAAVAEYGGDLLPVLASREDAVREKCEELFPELTAHAMTATNRLGWLAGVAAADRAKLDHDKVTPHPITDAYGTLRICLLLEPLSMSIARI